MPTAVILTALKVEYLAVRSHLTGVSEEMHPRGTVYERGRFVEGEQEWEVVIVEAGKGNSRAGVEAERVIQHFEPDVALFVGVAGGLKDVRLGDVIAATKVYGYESGKAEVGFRPRPELHGPDYALMQRARAVARETHWHRRILGTPPDTPPEARAAPVAAGESVVASRKSVIYRLLEKNYGDAAAVEMEGYGFLAATYANPAVRALVVRGVSDLVEGKTEADASGSQEVAARHASAFAFEILARLDLDSISKRHRARRQDGPDPTDPDPVLSGRDEPPASRYRFVGREAELQSIMVALGEGQAVMLHGLAGIGKSSLAVEAARRLRTTGTFDGVLWIAPSDTGSIDTLCDAVARELGGAKIPNLVGPSRFAEIRRILANRPDLLLVLDDVATPEVGTTFIAKCLPGRMAVLATGRRRQSAFTTDVHVKALDRDAAIALFCDRAQQASPTEVVADICSLLEHHPLALVAAAGRHRSEAIPLENLRRRLADEKSRLASLRFPEPDDSDHNVRASLNVSWEDLRDDQRQVLTGLAACYADTTLELLASAARVPLTECEDRVGELVARSLVDREGDRLHLHGLVRDFTRGEARQEFRAARVDFQVAVLEYFVQYGKDTDLLPYQDKLESELGNIVGVIRQLADEDDPERKRLAVFVASVLVVNSGVLRRRGYSTLRRDLARLSLELVDDIGDQVLAAETAHLAASAIADEGRQDEALALLQSSLAILQRQEDEPRVASVLVSVGNLTSALGDREGAYRAYTSSRSIGTKLHEQIVVAGATGQTGLLALELGNLAAAHGLYRHALEIYRAEGHREGMAACLHHLGDIASRLGYDSAARDLLVESLQLEREIGSLPGIANSLDKLIELFHSRSEVESLVNEYRRLLRDYERQGNWEGIAKVFKQMGRAAMRLGDLKAARDHYLQSLDIDRRFGGKRSEAVSLGQLGQVAQRQGQIQEAREFAEDSLDSYAHVGDEDGAALCHLQLGRLAEGENEGDQARHHYWHAFELWQDIGSSRVVAAATALQAMSRRDAGDQSDVTSSEDDIPIFSSSDIDDTSLPEDTWNAPQDLLGAWPGTLSAAYLREQTGQDDEASAAALAGWLGGFPPALKQAAASIRVSGIPMSEYLASFQERLREVSGEEKGPFGDPRAIIRTTLSLALRSLSDAPVAVALLHLCSFLGPSSIRLADVHTAAAELPEPLASDARDEARLSKHAEALERLALLSIRDGQIDVPPLVQPAVLGSLSDGEKRGWADAAVRLVYMVMPKSADDLTSRDDFLRLVGHAMVAIAHCELLGARSLYSAVLTNDVAAYFRLYGRLADTLIALDYALAVTEELADPDSPHLANALNNLAGALMELGDVPGARERYERALEIPVSPEVEALDQAGKLMSNYGHLLLHEEEFDQAWERFEWARQVHDQLHGRNHLTTAIDVHNLALVRRGQRRWSDARDLFEQALDMLRAAGELNTPTHATALLNLATVLFQLNNKAGARRCLDETIAIRERLFGEFHRDVVDVVSSLAAFLETTGDTPGARVEVDRATRLARHVYGKRHVATRRLIDQRRRLGD